MDEAHAKARLMAAYTKLRDEIRQQARSAPQISRQAHDIIERSLDELRQSIEADPAWLDHVFSDVGFHRRPPGSGGTNQS
jgi:hypothetical protein